MLIDTRLWACIRLNMLIEKICLFVKFTKLDYMVNY